MTSILTTLRLRSLRQAADAVLQTTSLSLEKLLRHIFDHAVAAVAAERSVLAQVEGRFAVVGRSVEFHGEARIGAGGRHGVVNDDVSGEGPALQAGDVLDGDVISCTHSKYAFLGS